VPTLLAFDPRDEDLELPTEYRGERSSASISRFALDIYAQLPKAKKTVTKEIKKSPKKKATPSDTDNDDSDSDSDSDATRCQVRLASGYQCRKDTLLGGGPVCSSHSSWYDNGELKRDNGLLVHAYIYVYQLFDYTSIHYTCSCRYGQLCHQRKLQQ
jgi:hypothetical protein